MALGAAIPLGYGLANAIKSASHVRIIGLSFCVLMLLMRWPLVHLWGYWALVTALLGWSKHSAVAVIGSFATLWLTQETTLGSWTVIPFLSLASFVGFFALLWCFPRSVALIVVGVTILTGYELYQIGLTHPTIQIAQDSSTGKGYTPGPTLASILKAKITKPGMVEGDIGVSSLVFDTGPFTASHQILIVEHDICPEELSHLILPSNARQSEPWFENQFLGNQYLLEAIAQDGFLASNLGGSLKHTGQLLLASLAHESNQLITPLVIKKGNKTLVQDSDPFVDRLACRQENVVKEIVRGRIEPRVLNLSLLFTAFLPLASIYNLIRWLPVIILLLNGVWIPKVGEVRIVGSIGWPHEPSKISGLITSLNDAGFNWRLGTSKTRLLAIGAGRSATRQDEELIILEPGAVVKIGTHIVRAGTIPLAVVNGILDARTLDVDGVITATGTIIDGALVIATGSPSKLEWKALLK